MRLKFTVNTDRRTFCEFLRDELSQRVPEMEPGDHYVWVGDWHAVANWSGFYIDCAPYHFLPNDPDSPQMMQPFTAISFGLRNADKRELSTKVEAFCTDKVFTAVQHFIWMLPVIADEYAEAYPAIRAFLISNSNDGKTLPAPEKSLSRAGVRQGVEPTITVPQRQDGEDVKKRRADVKQLWQKGELPYREIARRVTCSLSTVNRDLAAMGLAQKKNHKRKRKKAVKHS